MSISSAFLRAVAGEKGRRQKYIIASDHLPAVDAYFIIAS